MKESDLKPGDVTTLGALRPGDVGMFVLDEGESKPFVATAERDGGYVVIEYTNGGGVHSILSPVRYLGRGRIEPARIVMDGEPDRVAELESQVRALREACEESVGQCRNGGRWGMDRCTDRDSCNVCSPLRSALAATDHNAKEKACTT